MGVEHYLGQLLYRYNCVVVPGFGAFLAQKRSAMLDEASNTFYPPSKTIAFNGQLIANDGLLVSYMADSEKTDYDTMLQGVEETANNWKAQMRSGERLLFSDIGELWFNNEGNIQFQPSKQHNFLPSSFGLAPVKTAPVVREVLKTQVNALEEQTPILITPEKREAYSFRPYLKYAAIFLLAVSTGFTGYRAYQNSLETQQLAYEEAQQQVSKKIQEATFFDAVPMELPAVSLNVFEKPALPGNTQKTHHIIAGAFRFQKNADKKIRQLKQNGFNASYLGVNESGLHMVSYDSFTDTDKALSMLRVIKATQSSDAWLKSVK